MWSSIPPIAGMKSIIVTLYPLIFYSVIWGISAGVILSSIGLKINRSKMGKFGLIFSICAVLLFLTLVFVFPF